MTYHKKRCIVVQRFFVFSFLKDLIYKVPNSIVTY